MDRKQLAEILAATPDVGKVRHLEFASYITLIERKQKAGRDWITVETPYMSVDGRLAMAVADHRRQDKHLDILPAEVLVNDDRELTLQVKVRSEAYGERTGTATSRRVGGPTIEQQHPWEIAETSAIGRALACFGYGLLPGSGLASAEDMERALETPETTSHPSSQSGGGAGEATRPQTAEVDWKAVAKGFTQSELPKALLEACRTYWTAKGLNQDEVREAFRLVRDDYRADPDQCLADMSDLARKATAKEETK